MLKTWTLKRLEIIIIYTKNRYSFQLCIKKIDVYLIDEIRDKKNKEMYFIFFHETFV